MTDTTQPNTWLTPDSEEMLRALDAVYRETRHVDGRGRKPGEPVPPEVAVRAIAVEQLNRYAPEPDAMRELRYFFQTRDYDAAYLPLLPGQEFVAYSAVGIDDLASIRPLLDSLREEGGWSVAVEVSAYTEAKAVVFFDIELCRIPSRYTPQEARTFLMQAQAGDDWTEKHDEAAQLLGLDPDVYRADPTKTENWPADQLGKVQHPPSQHPWTVDKMNEVCA